MHINQTLRESCPSVLGVGSVGHACPCNGTEKCSFGESGIG